MKWIDQRLRYDRQFPEPSVNIHPSLYNKLWVPDLFFANEKKGGFHTLTTDNRLLSLRKFIENLKVVRVTTVSLF